MRVISEQILLRPMVSLSINMDFADQIIEKLRLQKLKADEDARQRKIKNSRPVERVKPIKFGDARVRDAFLKGFEGLKEDETMVFMGIDFDYPYAAYTVRWLKRLIAEESLDVAPRIEDDTEEFGSTNEQLEIESEKESVDLLSLCKSLAQEQS